MDTYNISSNFYDAFTMATGYARVPRRLVRFFREYAPINALPADSHVMDFGAGTGRLTRKLPTLGKRMRLTAMEPSSFMSDKLRVSLERSGHTFIEGGFDANTGTFTHRLEPRQFNLVASAGVFDHIRITPDVMQEFARLIKPRGYLLFTHGRNDGREKITNVLGYPHDVYVEHAPAYVDACLRGAGLVPRGSECITGFIVTPLNTLGAKWHISRMRMVLAQKPG